MDTKKWWESKGVWGGIISLGAAIAGAFGIVIDEGTQAEIVDLVVVFAGAGGGLLAIYGRITATKKIK